MGMALRSEGYASRMPGVAPRMGTPREACPRAHANAANTRPTGDDTRKRGAAGSRGSQRGRATSWGVRARRMDRARSLASLATFGAPSAQYGPYGATNADRGRWLRARDGAVAALGHAARGAPDLARDGRVRVALRAVRGGVHRRGDRGVRARSPRSRRVDRRDDAAWPLRGSRRVGEG